MKILLLLFLMAHLSSCDQGAEHNDKVPDEVCEFIVNFPVADASEFGTMLECFMIPIGGLEYPTGVCDYSVGGKLVKKNSDRRYLDKCEN